MTSPLHILNDYWGYTQFKPKQEEIINHVLAGKDTVALLPTGGGKSLCFQVPALAIEGICIVISPLVALMADQVKALGDSGIKALAITGGITFTELNTLLDNAQYGNYKFLYLSPERLQQEIVQNAIKRMNVNLIAVDEAHCISQWGNDFRPAYRNIHLLRELHPYVPVIALTATATIEVLEDTIEQLKLKEAAVFKNSFVRSNLSYQVKFETDKPYRLESMLKNETGNSIVYVRNRNQAEELSAHLNHVGITSSFYHGGISSEDKKNRLADWKGEQVPVMVSTNAFGMGIDHGNVRQVIHVQLPESIESYFQEAGRAGRDGAVATATILYNEDDKRLVKKQFVESMPDTKEVKRLLRTLYNYFQISYGEGEYTNHSFNFTEFCQVYKLNTLNAYNGLTLLDRLGVLRLSKEFGRKSMLQFLVSSSVLLKEFEQQQSFSVVGKTILRMYGGVFETANAIDLVLVSKKMGMSVEKVIQILQEMEKQSLVDLKIHHTDASITFLVPREDDKTINPLRDDIERMKSRKQSQVGKVIDYLEDNSHCKQLLLVRYFGEVNDTPCGICSYCKQLEPGENTATIEETSRKILEMVDERPMDSRSIVESLNLDESLVLSVIQLLLDAGKIKLNAINQYFKK